MKLNSGLRLLGLHPGILLAGNGRLSIRSANGTLAPRLAARRFLHQDGIIEEEDVGEDEGVESTGVIQKKNEETLLFFDKLLPVRTSNWDLRQYFVRLFTATSEESLKKRTLELACGKDGVLSDLEMTSFTLINRDGGAFVKFRVPEQYTLAEFNKKITSNVASLSGNGLLHMLTHNRCFPVKGIPWIEDLRRFATSKIKVSFNGPQLTQENMYLLFRRYGIIEDIQPPAPDSKEVPLSAYVTFRQTRSAITARHCVTGLTVDGTTIHIQYEPRKERASLSSYISGHPRIAIPVIIGILATVAVLIFDPIRNFFIREKISQKYSLSKNGWTKPLFDLFQSTTNSMKSLIWQPLATQGANEVSITGLWSERLEKAKQMKIWLEENVDTFIVLQGPRGSGKKSMIDQHVLNGRPNTLVIDCEKLIKPRSEGKFLKTFAQEIGYFPIFSWLNSVSSFVDLAVQGMTGQKSGLSESKESQVKNILNVAANAVRDIALEDYGKLDCGGDDANHPLVKEDDYLRQNPNVKPVIVIDRFQSSRRSHDPNSFIYREISEWAANLISMNVAHVIFITDDVGSLQTLSDALPSQVFKRCVLADASESSAIQYVSNQIGGDVTTSYEKDLTEAIAPFGGRMLDLQMFVRRLKSGEQPKEALAGMVDQTAEQLSQVFTAKKDSYVWNSSQAWFLIKILASEKSIPWDKIALHPLFKANPYEILNSMEKDELISIVRETGLVKEIKPAKPIYRESFKSMVENKRVFSNLETDYLTSLINAETSKIAKFEAELEKFKDVEPKLFKKRLQYLGDKIEASTTIIQNCEGQIKALSK
ncbi:unnamed protein product [Kuraishia capsulata CBS 1993]|uniref:Mitochondrial escape protein 2 n=1 Tax=Kuraishia capsulata CBS 1993 TaxID=1382522 RepID=W6MUH7_9ASCO|nr:uncharacterized protein KUCA_T00001605001 [Kuraishia capsulata CBS 1993]CDK25635.1 unnamed protein product [Kuraishia capsulata CBS 1993]